MLFYLVIGESERSGLERRQLPIVGDKNPWIFPLVKSGTVADETSTESAKPTAITSVSRIPAKDMTIPLTHVNFLWQ
uniref:Uncharacterized protein n=1 Tax=Romanomermis culicivorax TaxID=13658 RepID=A0A915IDF2_ROMCU